MHPALTAGVSIRAMRCWPESNKGHIGRLGWYTMKDEASLAYARIVQIGWTIGPASSESPATKALYVKPEGFEITPAATKYHRISQQLAEREGVSLSDALQQFMAEVIEAHGKGGRVVAHQIEFDAGVILRELRRCGMSACEGQWFEVARSNGFCTMNPYAGRWLRQASGLEVGPTKIGRAHV